MTFAGRPAIIQTIVIVSSVLTNTSAAATKETMMMRLIDADELKYKNLAEVNGKLTYVLTAEEIDNAPTIEAYPFEQVQELVKLNQQFAQDIENLKRPQGEWIVEKDNIFENFRKCSICNEEAEWLDGGSQFLSNFCPNCGAEMQKGGEK